VGLSFEVASVLLDGVDMILWQFWKLEGVTQASLRLYE
jgi:hypothetical protein